jgi:hypothetical protein
MALRAMTGGAQHAEIKSTLMYNVTEGAGAPVLAPTSDAVTDLGTAAGLTELIAATRKCFNALGNAGWTINKSEYPRNGDSYSTLRWKINWTWANASV